MPESIVFNMDCMEGMKQYPDKYFDLSIVDPPYGIDISKELSKRGDTCSKNGYRKYAMKDWDNAVPDAAYFDELFRVSKNQIIWGGNYFSLPPSRCFIVFDKRQRDFSFADAELAWTSFKTSIRCFDYSRGKMQSESMGKFHPTQKPIALYKWLLQNYAKAGDKILDTHLGSGSSRIACYDMGFDFTGYELDKDYFDAQEKRFNTHIQQQKLFTPDALPSVTQTKLL